MSDNSREVRPTSGREDLVEGSRSVEWLEPVQPIIYEPHQPSGSDLPDTGQPDMEMQPSPDASPDNPADNA